MASPPVLDALTAAQAAARLDVKIQTLYAYVSRGLITRHRTVAGSQFDPLDIERFAQARRRNDQSPSSRGVAPDGSPLMVIDTGIALIEDGQLYFRGIPAVELASTSSFEAAASFVLNGRRDSATTFQGDSVAVESTKSVLAAMPASSSIRDLLLVGVTALGAHDSLRATADPAAVERIAPELVGGLVDCLPSSASGDPARGSVAERLWSKLSPIPGDDDQLRLMDAALVLLIDHDMAISTLAARAAASARAAPYAVVATGLSALDSALHGRASRACYRLLGSVMAGEHPERALNETMRDGAHGLPGFGHPLYSGDDPRARYLLGCLEASERHGAVASAARSVAEAVERSTGLRPNIDLALAALAIGGGMRSSAGEGVFGIARSVGWLAHAAEEYTMKPMRMRPVGRYVGT